jgi:hypothetical protein
MSKLRCWRGTASPTLLKAENFSNNFVGDTLIALNVVMAIGGLLTVR